MRLAKQMIDAALQRHIAQWTRVTLVDVEKGNGRLAAGKRHTLTLTPSRPLS